ESEWVRVEQLVNTRWREVLTWNCLRLLLAPLAESAVLLDRMIYLRESRADLAQLALLPLFDPEQSPRNTRLVQMLKSKHTLLTAAVGFAFGCMLSYLLLTQWHRGARARLPLLRQLLAAEGQFVPRQPHDHAPLGRPAIRRIGENIFADRLKAKVRIFCWIMTSPGNHESKAVHLKAYLGQTAKAATICGQKEGSKAAFRYLYDHHLKDYDFFLKADERHLRSGGRIWRLHAAPTVTRTPASYAGRRFKALQSLQLYGHLARCQMPAHTLAQKWLNFLHVTPQGPVLLQRHHRLVSLHQPAIKAMPSRRCSPRRPLGSTSLSLALLALLCCSAASGADDKDDKCHQRLDVVVCVDASSSSNAADCPAGFKVSQTKTRMALVTYAQHARLVLDFNDTVTAEDFVNAFVGGKTDFEAPVKLVWDRLLPQLRPKQAMFNLMLVMDGRQEDILDKYPEPNALSMANARQHVFPHEDEENRISRDRHRRLLFTMQGFNCRLSLGIDKAFEVSRALNYRRVCGDCRFLKTSKYTGPCMDGVRYSYESKISKDFTLPTPM
uniref:VWFA domain-containing protein n=1 Tax=Macrostomum lignano TaxID=282301 RepID=A0A1I8JQ60_9PLAT